MTMLAIATHGAMPKVTRATIRIVILIVAAIAAGLAIGVTAALSHGNSNSRNDASFARGAVEARESWYAKNCDESVKVQIKAAGRNKHYKDGWNAVEREISLMQRDGVDLACEEVSKDRSRF
jgi:hypothetical protein